MMTHGCMLWGAALYNNGAVPLKQAALRRELQHERRAAAAPDRPAADRVRRSTSKGVLPVPRPAAALRDQPAGQRPAHLRARRPVPPEIGIPERVRGTRPAAAPASATAASAPRTAPTRSSSACNKTRLLDPTLNFLGTNDHPGDYRSSGCTACHVVYANDRSPVHSGPYAKFGNRGHDASTPTRPSRKDEPGHPIEHQFTNGDPDQPVHRLPHPPRHHVMNSYLGYMWWDEETDGELMYPERAEAPDRRGVRPAPQMRNPDEAAARGNWSDPAFLERRRPSSTRRRKHTQFADFHGHGWVFRAVFKKDRKGNLLDHDGDASATSTTEQLDGGHRDARADQGAAPQTTRRREAGRAREKLDRDRDGMPVHLLDIHLEKGMHCVDCHFVQDVHGNTRLQQEVRAAIEIQCIDCHGTVDKTADPADHRPGGVHVGAGRQGPQPGGAADARSGKRAVRDGAGDKLFQNSMVEKDLRWEVSQTTDTIDPGHPRYNEKSHAGQDGALRRGRQDGLGRRARRRRERLRPRQQEHELHRLPLVVEPELLRLPPAAEGEHEDAAPAQRGRRDAQLRRYNFQTLRDDVFMLARDGDVTGNRIGPARSSCAIHVGSYNDNRESIYVQQQTISAEGMSRHRLQHQRARTRSAAAGPRETKQCTDCHVSQNERQQRHHGPAADAGHRTT